MMLFRRLRRMIFLIAVLTSGLIMLIVGSNIYTFQRLSNEKMLAELEFRPLGQQRWQLAYRPAGACQSELHHFAGQQFRVDASFLKWRSWANLLGLDARYRLDRIESRFRDIESDQVVHRIQLAEAPWLGLRGLAVLMWPLADTVYGASAYTDIVSGQRYLLYRSQSGLLLRREPAVRSIHVDGELRIEITRGCDPD